MPRLLSLSAFDRAVYTRVLFAAVVLLVSITAQAGTFTNVSTALTAPATSTGSHTVSFKTSALGTHYLQEKKNSGSWVNRKTYDTALMCSSCTYPAVTRNVSRSGLGSGTYSYRVRFVPGLGSHLTAGYSNIKTTIVSTIPGIPSSISAPANNNDGTFTVSWGAASGTITSYKLQQQINGGSWSQIYSGTSRSKAVSGLADGSYKYRVQACSSFGCSSYRTAGNTTVVTHPPGVPPVITITEL